MSYDDRQKMWKLAGRYSSIGIEMAIAVAIGTFGGWWLDEKLDTTPWLFWVGLAIGVGAAIRGIMRVIRITKFED